MNKNTTINFSNNISNGNNTWWAWKSSGSMPLGSYRHVFVVHLFFAPKETKGTRSCINLAGLCDCFKHLKVEDYGADFNICPSSITLELETDRNCRDSAVHVVYHVVSWGSCSRRVHHTQHKLRCVVVYYSCVWRFRIRTVIKVFRFPILGV